jgi:hypothetical protein
MRIARIAAVLPVLVLAAACSSGSSGSHTARPDGAASPVAAVNGRAPLSLAQLTRALVTDSDVPGWVVQMTATDDGTQTTAPEEFDPDDLAAQDDSSGRSLLVADKAACQPLADVTSSQPRIHRMASVGATFARETATAKAAPDELDQMLISSHAPGDAQKVMASLRSALAACTSFTGRSEGGGLTPFTIAKGPAVRVGDDALSFVMDDTADKKSGAALVTVVHTGDTVTSYISMRAKGGAGTVPLAVARKQDQKLRAALAARK